MTDRLGRDSIRILLVDDDLRRGRERSHALYRSGLDVRTVPSGKEVLALVCDGGAGSPTVHVLLITCAAASADICVDTARRVHAAVDLPILFLIDGAEDEMLRALSTIAHEGLLPVDTAAPILAASIHGVVRRKGGKRTSRTLHVPFSKPVDGSRTTHYLEEELYDLLRRDQRVFDFLEAGSLDGIWYWDLEDRSNEWMSPTFWHTFGYGPQEKRHDPAEWRDMIHPEDLAIANENFRKHLRDSTHPYDQIVRYRHKDGSTVWVRCRGIAIRDERGHPVRMLGAHNEVTALKESEEHLRRLIEQQRDLLVEMNHRIKNNLNLLVTMVWIEQWQAGKSKAETLFDLLGRLRAVALIHEKLSKQPTVTHVDLEVYLDDLIGHFSAGSYRDRDDFPYRLSIDAPRTPSGVAMKLGIITNELLTNTAKYAPLTHTIVIECRAIDDDVVFSYCDGAPLPEDVHEVEDLKAGTGLTLIGSLATDLGGAFSIAVEDSLTFFVRFPGVVLDGTVAARREARRGRTT
ncbi:MAG: PAS domain-containing protein [Spirochaetales bacterium]|nr:PAS domain-containing protein [Spirochaetales bacterium]